MATYHTLAEALAEALAAGPAAVTELKVDIDRGGDAWAEWPAELWTLDRLEVLRLNQGRLFNVPAEIRALQRLRVLDLGRRCSSSIRRSASSRRCASSSCAVARSPLAVDREPAGRAEPRYQILTRLSGAR